MVPGVLDGGVIMVHFVELGQATLVASPPPNAKITLGDSARPVTVTVVPTVVHNLAREQPRRERRKRELQTSQIEHTSTIQVNVKRPPRP